jgi:Homeodomain-like domain-containing protein
MAAMPAEGVEAGLLLSHNAVIGEAIVGSVVLRVDYERWGQGPEDLHDLAVTAPHARSRERFLALYEMAILGSSATRVADRIGRHPQSVMQWVQRYNAGGPEAVSYRRTGGRPPFAPRSRSVSVRWCAPPRPQLPGPRR